MVDLPSFQEIYKLKPAAIASYPMYRGLARLAGMEVLPTGEKIEDEFKTLEENFSKFDFFFVHIKKTDSYGEDGNFKNKVKIIEELDKFIPRLTALSPDVIVVTGDHSTPSELKGHSWHSVPVLLNASSCRYDKVKRFTESDCLSGGLGRFPMCQIMALALAHAGKLVKYGA